ncbi:MULTISPECIES: hypothetical protein [unclassified Roseateles]|uniref:hypothetical protein n=1 Tax=unclassified Roseateles TaxID=2626991 RepID=UPI000715A5CB|nr:MULTISPECIES: hypothetical protein [unclassified Roseateles]KQW44847.1 hypothetical protein ASC81_14875 [Pelomonas sp. Root405]KRA70206.1 hypothetical protein ASD88_19035 [Pelomonas sp. Root662]
MRLFNTFVCALLRRVALLAMLVSASVQSHAALAVPADRWLEMDLYWFDPADVDASADRFWARYAPLYRGVSGHRGVVLSVGLTANFILSYSGDPAQQIWLPRTSGQELGHSLRGQLDGDTAQRQRAWRERFTAAKRAAHSVSYGRWTYADLRRLTDAMRERARREGISDFRMAAFVVGQDGAYGDPMPFARRHPEAFTGWGEVAPGALASSSHFDPVNALRADSQPLGGLPQGIPEGFPVHALFAAQWGAVSKACGLDGLMLRDSFSFPRAYTRYGPWGQYVPDNATAERNTAGLAALLRGVKQANPRTLTMMYSTAATATADWRGNGIDLERIARDGHLDIFVDQTWAGAWGEVGVREQTFWNAPLLGWTYQLGTLLMHAAVLADTRVRHYPLIETFDAWESWNTIHTAPERLRWAIWAYSHAGVKTPQGLRMPAGAYISWGHHGEELLSDQDVGFLSGELDAAAWDAAQTVDIAGPTLVYSRDAAAAQMSRLAPGFDPRDRLDEQVGTIIKWPLPVLSVTRAEWLSQVRSDLLLFGATNDLPPAQLDVIKRMAGQGQAMAFFGAVASGTHSALSGLLGVSSVPHRPNVQDRMLRAVPGAAWPAVANAGAFNAPPPATQVRAPAGSVVYSFGNAAGLVLDQGGQRNLALWDPVPFFDYWYRPLKDLLNGDATPYAVVAATLNQQLGKAGAFRAVDSDVAHSGTVSAWVREDGKVRLLVGNLEEGLRDDADRSRRMTLSFPRSWHGCRWQSAGGIPPPAAGANQARIDLPPQGSALFLCDR